MFCFEKVLTMHKLNLTLSKKEHSAKIVFLNTKFLFGKEQIHSNSLNKSILFNKCPLCALCLPHWSRPELFAFPTIPIQH